MAVRHVYHIPRRFGIGFFLGITTGLAILFASLRMIEAPPVIHFFFGTLSLLICIVQMRFESDPRRASILAGAIYLPLFFAGCLLFDAFRTGNSTSGIEFFVCGGIFFAIPGAFTGYLMGLYLGICVMLMGWGEVVWKASHRKEPNIMPDSRNAGDTAPQANGTTVPGK